MKNVNSPDEPLSAFERVCVAISFCGIIAIVFFLIIALCGCAYRGGKVVDGTNICIGMAIPGTDWSINALDYVSGLRVAGNNATHIVVSNTVDETNSYFGCVTTSRHTRMTADIEPVSSTNEYEVTSK